MKFLELKSSIKKEIKNVYIVEGNDEFLISQSVKILKEILVDNFEEFNFLKLDGKDLKDSDYKNILNTLPFGAGNRLVVIENINPIGIKCINEFSKTDFYGVVVAVIKPNEKMLGEVVDCNHLVYNDVKKWLNNFFVKNELQIDDKTLDYVIEISSGDLSYLNSELVKITGYLEKNSKVDQEIIKLLFTKNESYFVYNLTSAIDNKDLKMAMKILNNLQENVSIGDIFTFIGSYFRKMFYCSISTQNDNEIASILKTKPYAIQKSKEFVAKNGKNFYVKLYNKYVELDYAIKFGKITPINAIYSLLMEIK